MSVRRAKIVARITISPAICQMGPVTELLGPTSSILDVKLAVLEKVLAYTNGQLEPSSCVLRYNGQGVAGTQSSLWDEETLLEQLPCGPAGILEKLFFVLERNTGEPVSATIPPHTKLEANSVTDLWSGVAEAKAAASLTKPPIPRAVTTFEELEAATSNDSVASPIAITVSKPPLYPGAPKLSSPLAASKLERMLSRGVGVKEADSFSARDMEAVAMSFQAQIDELRRELAREQQAKSPKASGISTLLSRTPSGVDTRAIDRVSAELSQARAEIAQLRASLEQERKRAMKSQYDLSGQVDSYKQSADSLNARLQRETAQATQEQTALSHQIHTLTQRINDQTSRLLEKDEEIKNLVSSKGAEGELLQQRFSSIQTQHQEVAAGLRRELEAALNGKKEVEKQLVEAQAAAEQAQATVNSLQHQLQQTQARAEAQRKALMETECALSDLQQSREHDLRLLNNERDRAQSTMRHLQQSAAEEAMLKEEMRLLEEERKQEALLRQQEMEAANLELEQARVAMKEQYRLELQSMIAAKDSERAEAIHMMTLTKSARTRIVEEIISTEHTYVASLQACIDLYLTPLRMDCKVYGMTQDDVELLFRNLLDVAEIHKKMYDDLVDRFKAWTNYEMSQLLGDIFLEYIPVFRIYSEYVDQHPQALILLESLKGGPFDKLIKLNTENPRFHGQNLASCLIMPIQRIPRYKLLLQELIRVSESRHPDYDSLCLAVKLVKEVASHINESLRQNENGMVLARLRTELEPGPAVSRQALFDLLEPPRWLVFQGYLAKMGDGRTKRYMFFLFNDALVYGSRSLTKKYAIRVIIHFDQSFKIEEVKEIVTTSSPTTKGVINNSKPGTLGRSPPPPPRPPMQDLPPTSPNLTSSVSESKVADDGIKMRVTTGAKSFMLLIETDVDAWLVHLRPLCQTFEAKSGLTRATALPIDEATSCQICDKKFGIVRRRHHCRACACAVCHQCSLTRSVLVPNGESERVCDKCKKSVSS